jgi:hypothetical protein
MRQETLVVELYLSVQHFCKDSDLCALKTCVVSPRGLRHTLVLLFVFVQTSQP